MNPPFVPKSQEEFELRNLDRILKEQEELNAKKKAEFDNTVHSILEQVNATHLEMFD